MKYTMMAIPDGPAGIRETLKLMSRITKKYKSAPAIRELALRIINDSGISQFAPNGKKNWMGQVKAIHDFCKTKIGYIKDIAGVETIQTPIQTLRLKQGDCDDKSTLCASLLEAIGHPTRFVAVGFAKGVYSHVYPETKIGDKWLTLECTENWPVGKKPPNIKAAMVQHNRDKK